MIGESFDFEGNDLVWRNKPQLPAANAENQKLEEALRQKKIEVERLKLILQNNTTKGKNMQEHFNNICQSLSYKQQLYKTKERELESEVSAEKLLERDLSRHEQEFKLLNQEVKTLIERQHKRQSLIKEGEEKRGKLKADIQMDEELLMKHLQKSAQIERDNMALLNYASEDDSRLNQLSLLIEKLSKEAYERKSALDDANTEVFIVQSELDKMQEEFKNAYEERSSLIANWEKVINQIQQRNIEIDKLSKHVLHLRFEEKKLKLEEKEQLQLLSMETSRNDDLEGQIRSKDNFATRLHNSLKDALSQEEELRAQLATSKNVSTNLLSQKQVVENTIVQLEKQVEQKTEKIETVKNASKKLENEIEILTKETFEADHYIKELEKVLQKENQRNIEIQKDLSNIVKDILTYAKELKDLKAKEKNMDNLTKNCQADIRNVNSKIASIDRLRAKQESEMYEIESNFEKLTRRIKKMSGATNDEEKRLIESQKSELLATLGDKKESLSMLTEELKIMMEKITIATKELECYKRLNSEFEEKIKGLEFYIVNSQKALKSSVSRKQELLVQECFVKFHIKRYKKLLNNKNKSVFNLQKSKAEFETMMKERTGELKSCNDMLETELRSETEECSLIKRKLYESDDKLQKLKSRYKVIMDALGVSEPGESAETEMLIKAEEERRDLMIERDQLMSIVLKNEEELSALKNTLWMINAANEQFRQVVYPPGISLEDNEKLRSTDEESQAIAIKLHISKAELKSLENSIKCKEEALNESQLSCDNLQDIIKDRQAENDSICKELSDIEAKIKRADNSISRINVNLKKLEDFQGIDEDIRIHLLREIRRTVSDLLFVTVESNPEISAKVWQMFEEAQLPLPSRARSISSRSSSLSSLSSRASSRQARSGDKSGSSSSSSVARQGSRAETILPSIVSIGSSPPDSPK